MIRFRKKLFTVCLLTSAVTLPVFVSNSVHAREQIQLPRSLAEAKKSENQKANSKRSDSKRPSPSKGKNPRLKRAPNQKLDSKKAGKGVRKKRSPRLIQAKRDRMIADFVEYLSIAGVGMVLLALFMRYRKEFGEAASDAQDLEAAPAVAPVQASPFGAYSAKAVVLEQPAGPDPMTYEQTDVFQKVAGQKAVPSIALDLSFDGPELEQSISKEVDWIISSIKIKGDSQSAAPSPSLFLLPAEMMGHFEGFPGEQLVWSAPLYIKGVCEGQLAITNQRLLALYERRSIRSWPPALIYRTKRHQIKLDQISLYKAVRVNRPSFLGMGATVFWWFPFGTLFAVAMIGAYLTLTRRELGIWTASHKKTYPLSMVDTEEAMSSISRVTGRQPLGRHDADATPRKAS